jgi:hypothetical protein
MGLSKLDLVIVLLYMLAVTLFGLCLQAGGNDRVRKLSC